MRMILVVSSVLALSACNVLPSFQAPVPVVSQEQMIDNSLNGTVFIVAGIEGVSEGAQGSGFFIADNLIVTNEHVVRPEELATGVIIYHIKARDNMKYYEAELVSFSAASDIALLKLKDIDMFREENPLIHALTFSPGLPVAGETIFALGNPWGLEFSVQEGIVSNPVRIHDPYNPNIYIQGDIQIYNGNSGGALINANGEIIGISNLIITNSIESGQPGIMSYFIRGDVVQKVVSDLQMHNEVRYAIFDMEMSPDSTGLRFKVVTSENPALKVDDIILTINDKKITEFTDIKEITAALPTGSSATFTLIRNGQTLTTRVIPKYLTEAELNPKK